MTWRIKLAHQAKKNLRSLPTNLRSRISRAIDSLPEGHVKPLKGRPGEWSLRVGDWRVIFERDTQAGEIYVTAVRPRSRAYRD